MPVVAVELHIMSCQKHENKQIIIESCLASVSLKGKWMGTMTTIDYLYNPSNSIITKEDK